MTKRDGPRRGRRAFLKGGAVAAGGAAAVAMAGGTLAPAPAEEAVEARAAGEQVKGYRLTPHIERYYRLARG